MLKKTMSEQFISISSLNDFIFCPASIYFHAIDENADSIMAQAVFQIDGSAAHQKSDLATYSTKRSMLQGVSVCCMQYGLIGKIDTFDIGSGVLTERKKKIKRIYDGYIYQLYAQYYALLEMGYTVKQMRLYSMDDNRVYPVPTPYEDARLNQGFFELLDGMNTFKVEGFRQDNAEKCRHCIYEPLCGCSAEGV